ncbi:DUF2829 domain-containing protein [Companilactobacillus sp.]|uniref:DUF2829 domain-containing protein n=1 Tax=Companilactobacillus sp. TaxID=2767905 RepID=UPI00262E6ECC|nr:DUF2829 domain-containing protein [Companilactobacillus sp.]
MTFSEALTNLKNGYRVYREGWNGKHQFVYLVMGEVLQHSGINYSEYGFEDVFAILTESMRVQLGWNPSQADLLANDWKRVTDILEEAEEDERG